MSDRLGPIPFPQVPQTEGPLEKYRRQLDPLAKLTDPLWQTPATPPMAPIQPPMPEPGLGAISGPPQQALRRMMGPMGPTPGVQTPPQLPQPLTGALLDVPTGPSSAEAQQPGSRQLAQLAPAPDMPAGMLAGGGGPTDVTQFRQNPMTGQLSLRNRLRAASALAPPVPEYGGGSDALRQVLDATQAQQQAAAGPPMSPLLRGVLDQTQSQDAKRISTRIPSDPEQRKSGVDAHATNGLSIGLDSMQRAKEAWDKNAAMIKANYPALQHLRSDNPDVITERFINHLSDNLKWLYRKMGAHPDIGPGVVGRAKLWYAGANGLAHKWAREYNLKPEQVAAMMASLSPQKDWFQNVDLAKRLLDINQAATKQGSNFYFTPEMRDYADRYIQGVRLAHADRIRKREAKGLPVSDKMRQLPAQIDKLEGLKEKFKTTDYSQLTDPYEQSVWARWHDEAHNPRDYRIVNPEGDFGSTSMVPAKYYTSGKRKGQLKEATTPRKVSWGSFKEISKAMEALRDGSLETISRIMGKNHKIRNFYNNIIAHDAPHGDVTIDTHAIAAALLQPLGSSALEVGHGLGTSTKAGAVGAANNDTLGNKGLYGLYAEAYRRAAEDLKVLPRELQSVTWEGIRGLFSPEQRRDSKFVQHIASIWKNRGEWRNKTPDERREAIVRHAKGLKPPSWITGVDNGDEESGPDTGE